MATHYLLQIYAIISTDYIKLEILNADIPYLLNNGALDFKTTISTETGEISNKKVAEYHFCKITIYDSGYVQFSGSIHKFWNSLNGIKAPNGTPKFHKGFNGNQFTLSDFIKAKIYLSELFNVCATDLEIVNIEFGYNLHVSFNPLLFIKGLLYYKGKMFEFRYNRNYAQVEFQRYILKIYNKSNQYGMPENILRVEIKIRKTEHLKGKGIKTLEDINLITLQRVTELFLKHFKGISYYDYTINKKGLKKKDLERLNNYSNPRYWIIDLDKEKRKRPKGYLKNYIIKYSTNLHQNIIIQITQKCTLINTSYIMLNKEHKVYKKCLVTGVDISNQDKDSFLLAITGLNHLHRIDKSKFDEVRNKYLSQKWVDANLETQIFEIYHNIRNALSNQRIKQKRLYPAHQNRLFRINI